MSHMRGTVYGTYAEEIVTEEPDLDSASDDGSAFESGLILLFVGGIPGLMAGYTAGALCVGVAILINVIHHFSPVFVFVVPLLILAFLALAPGVYGWGVGSGVGYTALLLKHRRFGSTAVITMIWAVIGLALLPLYAEWGTPRGPEFFPDILRPFIGLMVGACLSFEWLAEPQPVEVAPWIVKSVLWVTGVIGVMAAAGHAGELASDEVTEEDDQSTDLL